jgi:cysteinyl-tRNA synthetase
MITLKLFDTLRRKKVDVVPVNGKYIKLYTCGPTVYDYAHIGNLRTYVFEDLLKRTLKFFGLEVSHVMNITDIDDKTIKGALKGNVSLKEYTKPFIRAFFEDLKILNVEKADFYPKATEYVSEMIEIIKDLLNKEIAYRGGDGSVYFSIKNFASYGKLSGLHLEELEEGASKRVLKDEYDKENAADFVLWKAFDEKRDGNVFWESPFGKGRPGWHIECSAMSLKLLGETIDIHCGGVDNIFPHHENEIAQSESHTNKEFVKCFAHSEHLIVEGKKMSKSLGNFYTLRNLLKKGYSGREIRYLLISTHYRTQLNFTLQGLEASKRALIRIFDFMDRLKRVRGKKDFKLVQKAIDEADEKFVEALKDDLNISAALGVLFDFIREVNGFCDDGKVGEKEAEAALLFLSSLDEVLGFLKEEGKGKIPEDVKRALEEREAFRRDKNWMEADRLRNFILSKGYVVEDSDGGAILKKRD